MLWICYRRMEIKYWWSLYFILTTVTGDPNDTCYRKGFFKTIFTYFVKSCKSSDKIFNCTNVNLKTLKASYLPEGDGLDTLVLKNCCLMDLESSTFVKMTTLSHLDMSYNSLTLLNYKLFNNMKSLTKLNLSYNLLEAIDYRILNSTVKLQHLDLRQNNLQTVDHRLFVQQKELAYVNLDDNMLYALNDERTFKFQSKLEELSIRNNFITYIYVKVLEPLNSIRKLELSGNPILCQCNIQATVVWCLTRRLDTNAVCEYPPDVTGKSWNVLNIHKNASLLEQHGETGTELCSEEETRHEEEISTAEVTALRISLACLGVVAAVISVILVIYCCKTRKVVSSTGSKGARRSSVALVESMYYESVSNVVENNKIVNHSNRPQEESVYDYADYS